MEYMKASSINSKMLSRQPKGIPMILCSADSRDSIKFSDAGYITVSLNAKLSAALIKFQPEIRYLEVLTELQQILLECGEAILLTDYEMLFDPRYGLDVLKVFCDLSRQVRLAVIWCGFCYNEVLEYSEQQYSDYHRYEISKYNVVCFK